MAKKSVRLSVGAIFTKGPGKIYFYRYQVEGRRKTVSLKTTQREEALKKAQELIPIIQASTPQIVAAHVEYAKGFREVERNSVEFAEIIDCLKIIGVTAPPWENPTLPPGSRQKPEGNL